MMIPLVISKGSLRRRGFVIIVCWISQTFSFLARMPFILIALNQNSGMNDALPAKNKDVIQLKFIANRVMKQ